jgi:hypothetical protein
VNGIRATVLAGLLLAVAATGCAGPPRPSAAGPGDGGRRLAHVYAFPASGIGLAPPTGRPVLGWRQVARAAALRGFFDRRRPPQLKLADYRNAMRGPAGPVLVWLAVDPASEVVEFGPDFGRAATRDPGRCPLYVAVDAASGRGYGAWQTCDPPYRG